MKMSNPYKAVIPIVSGIAYVENPIPELVKGSRTPYRRYTSDWEFLAPPSRDRAFEKAIAQEVGGWEHEVSVFRALGSGKHWVGVMYWFREEIEDYTLVSLAVTLQSGRSWAVAENKVLRWIKSPQESKGHYDETGAGQVTFLRWVFDRVKDDVKSMQQVMDTYKGTYAPKPNRMAVGWGDPKRERAYAYLTRLGFKKVADSGDGAPAYILDIEAPRQNPKKVPDVPVEATVRSERIGTKTRELTPGVHVVAQISRTGKEVWLTHGEQRLFLYLQDDQGRGSLFYQSFAGTGGKAQGFWFPSGGVLADQRGRGVWVIKGNPKTDPGAGRAGLLALYEKANAVLPQSDAETDAFVKKATRLDYDDLMYKDEYEIKPTMKILEEGHANTLQSKWSSWAYRFWALNALDKTWGKRTFNLPKSNPLVGFDRVPWKPGMSPRSEATFLSTAYPRLWEEALKNTALKIRVLVARDSDHMGEIGKNLLSINAAARRGGEIVILLLVFSGTNPYFLESSIEESKPKVGEYDRLSRPSPFMILHNLAEALLYVPEVNRAVMRKVGPPQVLRISIDPARVDTWSGRRGALVDEDNAIADLFAKYVTTGKVAYNGTSADISAIKKHLDVMVNYLKRNPGVYEILSGAHNLPAFDSDLERLSTPAQQTTRAPIDWEALGLLNNPKDLAGRYIPDRYLAGLPPALQKQRVRELTYSRDAYRRGDYSELPTDRAARKMGLVKQSAYTTVAKKRGIEWRGDPRDMAARVLSFYGGRPTAREVEALASALRQSFAKGLAAWKSGGHRPGATAQNWAVARVNSLVVGGKTAWTADKKQFASIPEAIRRVIASKLSEVKAALRAQGRTADVEFLQGAAKANPLETDDSRLLVLSLNVGRRSEQTVADVIIERSAAWARNLAITAGSSAQRRQQVQEEVAQTAVEGAIGYLMKVLDEEEIGQLAGILRKKSRLTEAEAEVISDVGMKVSAALGSAVEAGKKAALRQRKIEEMGDVGRMAEARRAVDFVRLEASAKRRLALRGKRATTANIADYMDMTLAEYQARKLEHTKPRYTTLEVHPELSEDEDVESEAGEKIGIATVEDRALAVQRDLELKAAHDSLIEAVDQLVGPGREYDHRSTGGQALLSMRALYEEGEDPTSPENITIIARRSGLLDKAKIKAIQTEALDLAGAILPEKVRQILSASELPALYGGEKVTKAIPERKNRRQR
jgi:hypothetical protein